MYLLVHVLIDHAGRPWSLYPVPSHPTSYSSLSLFHSLSSLLPQIILQSFCTFIASAGLGLAHSLLSTALT
ncbi:hypothetical protein DFP73DRAFT_633831 [Morchella snyderi]|nr:hypothetical protein DFP73DRAFT_633831 [Morchella snyderi]